ncbi:hypothetical protein C8R46DRAFT_1217790 [Mycena filopes]|nr:hypothetical protein C8R46DRAFT_1217790 [Mycena filopes]
MAEGNVNAGPAVPPDKCHYNPRWMDSTFRSPKEAKSLLGPELESGNLSRRDYDALLKTLPGFRFTEVRAALSAAGMFTSRARQIKIIGGYVLGSLLGSSYRLYQHRNLFNGVENITGFARAMDNIKAKVGYTPGAVVFVRPLFPSMEDGGEPEHAFEQDAPQDIPTDESMPEEPQQQPLRVVRASPPPTATASSPQPRSRWDEIRAERRRPEGPGKAWDNIRAGRRPDGSPLPKQELRDGPDSAELPFRDSDRAAEQANFDALLEKERKMGS